MSDAAASQARRIIHDNDVKRLKLFQRKSLLPPTLKFFAALGDIDAVRSALDGKETRTRPASILHHLVFLPNPYESMRFLSDRGIDMTIKDYRWNSNAQGWARYGKNDEKMAQWLEDAERQRQVRR
jgi:hypothetical protein